MRSTVHITNAFFAGRRREGMALVSALAMLMLFSLLGAAYVRSMRLEFDSANYATQEMRARYLARGGINAAVGVLERAVKSGVSLDGQSYTFDLPLYMTRQGEPVVKPQQVTVRMIDESGRLNINHTSLAVMEAVGIDRVAGGKLRNGLPRANLPSTANRKWLASMDGLLTRGFLDARAFAGLNREILTVYTVANPLSPAGYININTASAAVLAAIFNLPPAEAETLAASRPFSSWQDAVNKIGRDPTTYNVGRFLAVPGSKPPSLSLTSRCYRLVCEGFASGPGARPFGVRVEAVVLFDESGGHRFRYWDESTAVPVGDTPATDDPSAGTEEANLETSGNIP